MIAPRDSVGQRSETVRRSNLSAIVRELHLRGPLSRSDLVAHTGLTRSAIRGLIGELVGGGLVTETRSAPAGTPGRPSPIVHPEPRAAVVLALEVTVDSLAAACVGFGGAIHALVRVDRPAHPVRSPPTTPVKTPAPAAKAEVQVSSARISNPVSTRSQSM